MIRVVIDTNVIISAMLRSGGLPEAVFNRAIDGAVHLFISEPVLAEYEEVLRRPRFAFARSGLRPRSLHQSRRSFPVRWMVVP